MKCVKADLQRVRHKRLANLVVARSPADPRSPTVRSPVSVQSPPGIHVATYALWQDLPEVKKKCLLHSLTSAEVRQQEVDVCVY